MDLKRLEKLIDELNGLRRGRHRARAYQQLATSLGRKLVKRGKEPMWESEVFPDLFPLAIPDHGGADIPIGTQKSILNQLESDVECWRDLLGD